MRSLLAVAAAVLLWLLISPPVDAATTPFKFTYIKFDPSGADTGHNLVNEYLKIKNVTSSSKAIAGYRVRDLAGHRYTFPAGAKIPAHGEVVLRTGKGTNTSRTFYWDAGTAVWNNDGDKAYLYWPGKTSIDKCRYSSAGTATHCGEA